MLRLDRKLVLPCCLEEVFHFFADPSNFEQLTTRFSRIQNVTPMPLEMCFGVFNFRHKALQSRFATVESSIHLLNNNGN